MLSNIFILLRQELILSLLIFLLLFIKIGKERSNEAVLNLINILLFVNLAAGLFGMSEGGAFNAVSYTHLTLPTSP
jgi:NADH-quinone oxidoreductase subunit N